MRKAIAIGVIVCLGFALAGCGAYRSVNGIRIQGKNVDAKYSQLTQTFSFVGEQVQATIIRQSALTTEKVALKHPELFNLPNLAEGQLSFKLDQNGQLTNVTTSPRVNQEKKPLTATMKVTPVTK